jgi:hypothetical protein
MKTLDVDIYENFREQIRIELENSIDLFMARIDDPNQEIFNELNFDLRDEISRYLYYDFHSMGPFIGNGSFIGTRSFTIIPNPIFLGANEKYRGNFLTNNGCL